MPVEKLVVRKKVYVFISETMTLYAGYLESRKPKINILLVIMEVCFIVCSI